MSAEYHLQLDLSKYLKMHDEEKIDKTCVRKDRKVSNNINTMLLKLLSSLFVLLGMDLGSEDGFGFIICIHSLVPQNPKSLTELNL